MTTTKNTMVCGDCWSVLRPTEYEPNTFNLGECDRCHQTAAVHRVRREELEQHPLHTLRPGSTMFHTMDCPGCQNTPFTASPRSETYWCS
jgi:uncharacterized CHY-type Zn-finger protein